MAPGIRVEVSLDAGASCPVTRAATETGTKAGSVSRSRTDEGTVIEEFSVHGDVTTGDRADVDWREEEALETVFSADGTTVFRFERSAERACPCETIERLGTPVDEAVTRDGRLHVTFHATDVERLRGVLSTLRDSFEDVSVRRLVRSGEVEETTDLVFVDRGSLTDRQREVLETAHEMGYFEYPRGANAGEVADELGITTSTFTEHLAAAQGKILDAVLDE